MDVNTRITDMLGTGSLAAGSNPQSGPSAGGPISPSINAMATNGKLVLQNALKLAETLTSVKEELSV